MGQFSFSETWTQQNSVARYTVMLFHLHLHLHLLISIQLFVFFWFIIPKKAHDFENKNTISCPLSNEIEAEKKAKRSERYQNWENMHILRLNDVLHAVRCLFYS